MEHDGTWEEPADADVDINNMAIIWLIYGIIWLIINRYGV
jgi:hypothetical protein